MKLFFVTFLAIVFLQSCGQSPNNSPGAWIAAQKSNDATKVGPSPSSSAQTGSPSPNPSQSPSNPSATPDPQFSVGDAPDDYLSVDAINHLISDWAGKASPIATVQQYGTVAGQAVQYLRISSAVSNPAQNLPKILIDASTHGDEPISVTTVLGFTHLLLSQFGRDPEITELIKTRDIYVVPLVCPDGYAADSREVEGGQDPNRTYPYPGNENQKSVQCIQAMRDLFIQVGFNATIDYHASGRMVLLPWGYTETAFNDGGNATAYKNFGQKLGGLAGYDWGQIPSMVGYIAPGGSVDWYYIEGQKRGWNTMAIGVEVAESKQPARSEIPIEVAKNVPLLKTFIREAPTAFKSSYATDIPWPRWKGPSPFFVPFKE